MLLVAFPQKGPAGTLVAYLQGKGIECHCHKELQQYQVILNNEADFQTAREILQQFLQNPNAREFQQVAWQNSEPVSLNGPGTGLSLTRVFELLRNAPVSASLLFIALAIHTMVFLLGQVEIFDRLYFMPWSEVTNSGEYWRLLTPTLMHFSALHLIFNLAWWWTLGKDIEAKFGATGLILLYLATGLLSNYTQFLVSGPGFGGLSGVVYGLFGFVWWCGWLRPQWGLSLSKPLVGFMLLWLLIGFADVLWINMANTAHLTGLVCGCMSALLITRFGRVKTT
ncbi:rhomboid family intramembrane serine protease GlpG [Planctobacterium marinum]|uniref:Rhomboid family intramembrane serine protease GlpG n=1 Tax=Planctobacterium marinum TaxID=1631968 RepID=A0AA48KPZ5_9ALTE|nr:rhomboid family intramembrane serine protease GlpG [Planctobacterium marinum]